MENKYGIAPGEVSGQIVDIKQAGVNMGLLNRHMEPGYVLADGTAVLENEKDEAGFYIGGAGMDGMFMQTPDRYEPVRDDDGNLYAFRHMSRWLTHFTAEEQELLFQYGMNTRNDLVQDLTAALPALKKSPQVYGLFSNTAKKLCQVPEHEYPRLMADIRAAYKGRNEQSIRERQKAARKSRKKGKDIER